MKALITGISGFVGRHLASHLLEQGNQVLGLNRKDHQLSINQTSVACCGWDITKPFDDSPAKTQFTVNSFEPEIIYHLAALSIPALCGSPDPTPEAYSVNVQGTQNVLELANTLPHCRRVILISSSHVYQAVDTNQPIVSEESKTVPLAGYGKTKLAAEELALEYASNHPIEIVITRSFQHTGPGQTGKLMLPEWISQLKNPALEKISIHRLDGYLDLSDVRDVVAAYSQLAIAGESGAIYNVGSGKSRKTSEIIKCLKEIAQDDRPLEELFPGKKQDPIADNARLIAATNWQPEYSLDQTLRDSWLAWED